MGFSRSQFRSMLIVLMLVFFFGSLLSGAANDKKNSSSSSSQSHTNTNTNASRPAASQGNTGYRPGNSVSPSYGGHTGVQPSRGPSANGTPAGARTSSPTQGISRPATNPNLHADSFNHPMPARNTEVRLSNGLVAQKRPGGQLSVIHDTAHGITVHQNLNGGRRVVAERPGGIRIVAQRGYPGYVQHSYSFHGHELERRSYFYHGRAYNHFYRGYNYRGVNVYVYAPGRYYGAGFYGWAYNPWRAPIVYAWGWNASPWYGYYGYYFTPFAAYPNASYWLTDYMISADLQAQYQANQENGGLQNQQASSSPELTPEIKSAVAQEVQNQLALENYESQQNAQGQDADPSSSGIARILADGRTHVFVAGDNLDVVDTSGAECSLTPGDVLQLNPPVAPSAPAVNLVVLASKGGTECAKSDTVTVAVNDMQEMQNQMRSNIDQGLAQLHDQQGQGGIPQAPPSAQSAPADAAYAQSAPPPDPDAASEISQQDSQGNVVVNQAGSGGSQ